LNNKNAYKISLFLAVLGLTLMYASSLYIEPAEVEVSEIKSSWQGKKIMVEGVATSIDARSSMTQFQLESGNSSVKVVKFERLELEEGSTTVVEGKIDLYRGDLQVQASKITQK
jgi:RecJ-like exonuclease